MPNNYLIEDLTLGKLKEFIIGLDFPDDVPVTIGSCCCGCSMDVLARISEPTSPTDSLDIDFA